MDNHHQVASQDCNALKMQDADFLIRRNCDSERA